jgi:hypothetical protein
MSAWWANFIATSQDGHLVLWAEFHVAFRGHHIPAGLMAHKLQEFLHLQQGSGSVYKYSKKFNHLSQYGSYHADTVLHEHLTLFWSCTINELVSASIELEDTCRARLEERKKRHLSRPTRGAPPKYRLVYTPPSGQPRGPPFIIAVESPSTSACGPTSSSLPAAGYSTSSSVANWGRFLMFQLRSD